MAKVTRNRPLLGDFDVRVQYHLEEWPANNGVKVSLGTESGSVQRASDRGEGGEVYLTHFENGVASRVTTTDTSGRLRLTRTGGKLAAYVYDSGRWRRIRIESVSPRTPLHVHLAAWSHDRRFSRQQVRVTLDRFYLRRGERRSRVHSVRRQG
jgi:hypothetical protein